MLAIASPFPQYFDADGAPLSAGYLYFGTVNLNPETSPITVYWDAAATQPAAQPVRTLNGYPARNGTPALIYASGSYSMTVRDTAGRQVIYAPDSATFDVGTQLQAQLAALIANLANTASASKGPALVGYSPTLAYADGTVGGKLNEILSTTGFASLQAAVTSAAGKRLLVIGQHTLTAAVNCLSNTEIILTASAVVTTATADISLFTANGATNITITGPGTISKTVNNGTVAYTGGVKFTNCTNCHVFGVAFVGMQWSGVYLDGSSYCTVRACHMSGWLGVIQDANDICVLNAGVGNIIDGNFCYGGGEHGVLLQDPYANLVPVKNIISGNRIGQHTGYGVALYLPSASGALNSFNQVIGNHVENIQGSFASNRDSGSGIYLAGLGLGGVIVSGNTVTNCCVQTTGRSLAPAGIGVNGAPAGIVRPVIANNTISGMTQGDGILVTSSPGGCAIDNNTVDIPASNNGAGVGGATLLGSGVRIDASSGVCVDGGIVAVAGTGAALYGYANGSSISGLAINGGKYSTASTGSVIQTAQVGGFVLNDVSINGVICSTSNATAAVLQLANIAVGSVSGVLAKSANGTPLSITACTQLRVTGGSFTGSSGANVVTSGTCTGSRINKSAYWGTAAAGMNNAGTGLLVEWASGAAPAAGTWAVGDRTEMSVPVVGQPKGWRCTVPGTSGTQVSEGNL